jgi:2-polyprenyl-6-methoxyphenol hydroxylase-like FAD-dependent oxidoreductase
VADIAIIGGGPGGLTAAIALARRGIRSTVFERDGHPENMPRFNPDRSYPIDLTGHGLRAVGHIDAVAHFDAHMTPFHGIKDGSRVFDSWSEPGWIGSRGDILCERSIGASPPSTPPAGAGTGRHLGRRAAGPWRAIAESGAGR